METEQIIILGLIQGLTEFLPISSSGHLILIPQIFSWPLQSLTFDVALHLGTLLALIYCFGKSLSSQLRNRQFLGNLLVATLPAVLAGLLLDDFLETSGRNALLVASNLIIFGLLMWYADRQGRHNNSGATLNYRQAFFIGIFQAIALLPGVSRSGITITAGLFKGLDRVSAAEFSFILVIPIIAGAGLFKLGHLIQNPQNFDLTGLALGSAVSAIVGILVIKYFLRFLENHSLQMFVIYRIILGLCLLFLLL